MGLVTPSHAESHPGAWHPIEEHLLTARIVSEKTLAVNFPVRVVRYYAL